MNKKIIFPAAVLLMLVAIGFTVALRPGSPETMNEATLPDSLDPNTVSGLDSLPSAEQKLEDIVLPDGSRAIDALVSSGQVTYFKNISGFLAQPKRGGTYPALILIHEWWGLNDNIRALAKQFAAEGYVALAVDLYEGKVASTTDEARALAGAVRGNLQPAFANLKGAVSYLQGLKNVSKDKLASVGWCFGGGWSYEMAKNNLGVKASIMYYGQFNPKDDLSEMRAHILGHFGENDRSIKVDDVKTFQATLKTLSGEHEVFIYPNAGHGFANEGDGDYVPEAANLAWQRTIEFLSEQFKK